MGSVREQRRIAGELGPDQVVLQATDQLGAHECALHGRAARGHRRQRLGSGGDGDRCEGLRLRSASGREGLVAWDTLRDRESGRLQLTYGDALTIDATQGLTSTEHIEAMPAGTRAVDAFKAYTSGSGHRQATFIVVSERAGRRPINDPRPIRAADVWANMARNLARAAGEAERARLPFAHR